MAAIMTSETISKINEKEKEITHADRPVANGPTAVAQSHANEIISASMISDITRGEENVTDGKRIKGGPTSTVQSIVTKCQKDDGKQYSTAESNAENCCCSENTEDKGQADIGHNLDGLTISKICDAEKDITHSAHPVKGGPTAKAQKHVGEVLNAQVIHDITEAEKTLTGSKTVVKGGPTAICQKELAKNKE